MLSVSKAFGANNFVRLCDYACKHGYCPIAACTCSAMGPARQSQQQRVNKAILSPARTPATAACAVLPATTDTLQIMHADMLKSPSPRRQSLLSSPPACTAGSGDGKLADLCSYTCSYGYCPIHSCTCTGTGALNVPPPTIGYSGSPLKDLKDSGLCNFACSRGHCPIDACSGVPGCCFFCLVRSIASLEVLEIVDDYRFVNQYDRQGGDIYDKHLFITGPATRLQPRSRKSKTSWDAVLSGGRGAKVLDIEGIWPKASPLALSIAS